MNYVARVNRAIDYIVQNLAEPLDLEQVAGIARFSSFHFHRVFKALVGETLAAFVKRVRLQRAIQMMSHRPDSTLNEIALACGFASSSDFSRSFKQRYGIPPRAFDVSRFRDGLRDALTPGRARLPAGENPDGFAVSFRDLPTRFAAYIRDTSRRSPRLTSGTRSPRTACAPCTVPRTRGRRWPPCRAVAPCHASEPP